MENIKIYKWGKFNENICDKSKHRKHGMLHGMDILNDFLHEKLRE
jgi:hypothetical protein